MDSSFLLRIGNKTPMKGVTEIKFGAKTKGWTIQRLPHPGIHPIISHQTQTLLHNARKILLKGPCYMPVIIIRRIPMKKLTSHILSWNISNSVQRYFPIYKHLQVFLNIHKQISVHRRSGTDDKPII